MFAALALAIGKANGARPVAKNHKAKRTNLLAGFSRQSFHFC